MGLTGLLLGAMLPFASSAMTLASVGYAAQDMVEECRLQFTEFLQTGKAPEYDRRIRISTKTSLKEMIAPKVLINALTFLAGFLFGRNCTAGLFAGALVSGVLMEISMSNTAGPWDNAEISELGMEERKITDALVAVGNTASAIGKGFAIGSAALVSLALFCTHTVRADIATVEVLVPWAFTGLLLSAMIPLAVSAMTLTSAGCAAQGTVEEGLLQFKEFLQTGKAPDYDRCIRFSIEASLKEMIAA